MTGLVRMPQIQADAGLGTHLVDGEQLVQDPGVVGVHRYAQHLAGVVAGVGRMKIDDVTRGVMPFMIAEFAVLFLMVLFPSLVTVPAKWFTG